MCYNTFAEVFVAEVKAAFTLHSKLSDMNFMRKNLSNVHIKKICELCLLNLTRIYNIYLCVFTKVKISVFSDPVIAVVKNYAYNRPCRIFSVFL